MLEGSRVSWPADSVHPDVKVGGGFLCFSGFGAGDEGTGSEDVAERMVGGFTDADARSDLNLARAEGVFADPQG